MLPIQAAKRRSFAFDEQFSQIFIPTFTDAQKRRLSSRGVLPWNKAEPGCEVASFLKASSATHCDHQRRGDDRANAGGAGKQPTAGETLLDSVVGETVRRTVVKSVTPLAAETVHEIAYVPYS